MNPQEVDKLITRLDKEVQDTSSDDQMKARLEALKERAKTYKGEDEVVSFETLYEKAKNTKEAFNIKTGWTDFDKLTGGFRPQQFILVCALTKSGKTTWSMDLTSRIAEHNPLWFPYEESAEELMRKYAERGLTPPHGYVPSLTRPNQLEWLEARVIEGIAKFGSNIVFIDHLQFLVPKGPESLDERYGRAATFLKELAKKWNICIVCMAQLRKPESIDKLPDYNDIKNSSEPSQHCDTAIVIYRETKKSKQEVLITNNTIVSVQLNRRFGSTGTITMVYENGRFIEKEWREDVIKGEKVEKEFNDF